MRDKTSRWELKLTVRGGHRYFAERATGRVAVADNSGKYPDETDDRELYLDPSLPIIIRNGAGVIPVLDRFGGHGVVTETLADAIRVGLAFGHRTYLEVAP